MNILEGLLASLLGFSLYLFFSHPKYWKKKIPTIRLGKIQILPNLKIKLKNQTIHLHHWIFLSAILSFLNHIAHGIDNLLFLKLFAIGGIIQGFTFKDKFRVFVKNVKPKKTSFKPNSPAAKLGLLPRLAVYIIVTMVILASFFGSVFQIAPVKAQVLKKSSYLKYSVIRTVNHEISKVDNTIDHFHPLRRK